MCKENILWDFLAPLKSKKRRKICRLFFYFAASSLSATHCDILLAHVYYLPLSLSLDKEQMKCGEIIALELSAIRVFVLW